MNDICVPIPRLPDATHAEVEVKVEGRKRSFNYRLEVFDWQPTEEISDQNMFARIRNNRINQLKQSIENYDKHWELVQIYNPGPRDKFIQVLFRQKN